MILIITRDITGYIQEQHLGVFWNEDSSSGNRRIFQLSFHLL